MPLEILVAMVLIGTLAIAILLHMTGRSAPVLMTQERAAQAWHRHDPDSRILKTLPSTNRRAALIETNAGLGLVWCFGADTIARPLLGSHLTNHPKGLRVSFADFATPSVLLHLTEVEKVEWRQHISAARPTNPSAAIEQTGQTHA
ncbi:hypothetical protein [Phaeobacter porticola]|uniref:Uncharacterized protein n=1 Tax=Phaeobacter porticola TaxID=1844006 RepID=A0A1L3I868_9RHOB|nr:hypothetical protein [Phaeobacter porticola]APG48388.1 hypothetical protein PhaeoP97_03013 [Phaeobacter porticola]